MTRDFTHQQARKEHLGDKSILKKLMIDDKQTSSSLNIEMDAEVEALYADLEEIEHIVASLQMMHARPEKVMTDELLLQSRATKL